jgi:hypothetical protein
MKNADSWDIKTQCVPRRRHSMSPLQSPASYCYVRFEVFTAVTMKNADCWDIKTQCVPRRRHIMSPLQSAVGYCYVKNAVLRVVTPCGFCKNRRFGGPYRIHRQGG